MTSANDPDSPSSNTIASMDRYNTRSPVLDASAMSDHGSNETRLEFFLDFATDRDGDSELDSFPMSSRIEGDD